MSSLDGGLDLLDREVVDAEGRAIGKVDDLDLTDPMDGPPTITALLLGPAAYGRRLGGRIGEWIEGAGTKLADTPEPIRIPMDLVDDIAVSVRLRVMAESLQRPNQLEHWLRDRIISRIPGARRASE